MTKIQRMTKIRPKKENKRLAEIGLLKSLGEETMKNLFVIIFICITSAVTANAQIASGGNYTIEKSVIAGGGATSSSGNYTVEGTIGQNAAGTVQQNSSFKVQPGFWTAEPFAPTAAEVTVSGSVKTADGRGINNVLITMTGANGETRTVISSSFGFFRFNDVEVGGTYIFTVKSKRFIFAQPMLVRSILEDADDINFIAEN